MRRNNLFWGTILVVLGVLFLLRAMGWITGDVMGWFWPIFLILLGGWVISGSFWRRSSFFGAGAEADGTPFDIDLQGAAQAAIKFEHGAGRLEIGAGAPPGRLLSGNSGLGVTHSSELIGDKLEARISAGPTFIPFVGPGGGIWRFQLTPDTPLSLHVSAGASELTLDLSDLQVTYLKLETGASSTVLTVPRRGVSLVDIEAGAASIDIRVPDGVAARVRLKGGLSSTDIDGERFPNLEGRIYQSADYNDAANRAEITIEAGVGKISVH